MSDSITILYGPDVQAAKGDTAPIRMGYALSHETIELDGFAGLVSLLESLADMPSAYVVRGVPIDGAPARIRRRYRNEPRHLLDAPHHWLLVDIDARAIHIDVFADPAGATEVVRAGLPEGLRESMCYYAITRRAEPHVYHGHLWFWLDRPYGRTELRRYLGGRCDESLFTPTQPHFTARPILSNDPLDGRRRGFLEGSPTGWLSEIATIDPAKAQAELQAACAEITTQKKGDRHRILNRKAFFLGRHVATGALEKAYVIGQLVNAARAAQLDNERANDEVIRAINDGQRATGASEAWRERLQTGETGAPKSTYFNIALALSDSPEWSGTLGWNERQHQVAWRQDPPYGGFQSARTGLPFLEEHALIAAEGLAKHGITTARATILDTVADVAHRSPFDPVRDILDECDWDGTERLSDWLLAYCGVHEDKAQWARLVGRKWLISGVARAYEPGCKADCILILEGLQGRFKSTALDILGLGYTREIRVRLDDKDASDAIHSGAFIAVLTELDAFKRTRGKEAVKSYLSALDDYFRRAYARITTTHPRSIVFAATTNEESYLNDPTGNRRFWPVFCHAIDLEALRRDVYQLWAEARQAYLDGEAWWLEESDQSTVGAIEQQARLMPDSWEEYIREYVKGKTVVTLKGVLQDGLELSPVNQTEPATARVVRFLNQIGFGIGIRSGVKVYQRLKPEPNGAGAPESGAAE